MWGPPADVHGRLALCGRRVQDARAKAETIARPLGLAGTTLCGWLQGERHARPDPQGAALLLGVSGRRRAGISRGRRTARTPAWA